MLFDFIQQKIMFLEKQDVLLTDLLSSFEEVVRKIAEVSENKGRTINNK